MNAKLLKRIRRKAEEITVGRPARGLLHHPSNRTQAINNPHTTRGIYRAMKAAVRKGAV